MSKARIANHDGDDFATTMAAAMANLDETPLKTRLTDAQYAALDTAAHNGDTHIRRGEGVSEATLRSLATKHYGELEHELVGRRKVVTAVRVSNAGWLAWTAEADRRAAQERAAANARITTPDADPFTRHRNTLADRIDAAFAA
jgi:hypothetical protein